MDTIDRTTSFDVTTLEELSAIYQAPKEAVLTKQTDFITPPGRALIEASPFIIMATATEAGIDCSPKGDFPGFIKI
ncbi:MAG: putative pyridoxine 5'-phosphate oxidase superfamily flavin-nucleotide-binding protein, partial [Alphaproteobacteria bacterium]